MHQFWHFRDHGFGGRHRSRGGFGGMFGGPGGFMGGRGGGLRASRMISSEDLQLIILNFLKTKPSHGYELIKELEVLSNGLYAPSPGIVYPALTYLEEIGQALSEQSGNKKLYTITKEGLEYLEQNTSVVDDALEKLKHFGEKMARLQKHLADEEAENDLDRSEPRSKNKTEWRKMKMEFHELKHELRDAIFAKIDSSPEEIKRVLGILRKAIDEIREK